MTLRRGAVATPDGDLWQFDWLATAHDPLAPLVVMFHGLEGGSGSHYARELFACLGRRRWQGVVPHFRGCPGIPNRLPRAYHSGDHEEIGAMLDAIRARVGAQVPIAAVGVSLGGSALLNWLGRAGAAGGAQLRCAATVSAPLDLMAAGRAIDRGFNRLYAAHFLTTMKPKALAMATRHPGLVDADAVRRARSMWAFDDLVTARLHGFQGTHDYWTRASCRPWLASIGVPTLILNARNDPFVPGRSLPGVHEVSSSVTLEQPSEGGHVGFLTGAPPGRLDWLALRLLAFVDDQLSTAAAGTRPAGIMSAPPVSEASR